MGWQDGTGWRNGERVILLCVVSILATPLLTATVGCQRAKLPTASRTQSDSVPKVVRLPESNRELAARLAVHDLTFRTGPMGPAHGWRMDLEGSAARGWRWQHQQVESLRQDLRAASAQQRQAILLLAAATPDKSVGANGLIALAREGNHDALSRLLPLVDAPDTPTTIRCAALETAALAHGHAMMPYLVQIVDSSMAEANSAAAPVSDHALVAEALRNLAIYRSVEEEPRFGLALAHPAEIIQLAALEAWETPGTFPPPPNMIELFSSREQKVRAAAVRVLAMRPLQGSYQDVSRMMRDPHYQVQQAAAQAMLALDPPQALADLQRRAAGGSELVRASIATAFAQYGYYDAVYTMSDDSSWRVRKAVAETIENDSRGVAGNVAEKMLADRSPQVQAAAISSIAGWPVRRGGKLLLAAMNSNAFVTREAARVALSQNWPGAEVFSSSAPAEQRQQMIASIDQAIEAKFSLSERRAEAMELSVAMRRLIQADVSERNAALNLVVASIEEQQMAASQAKRIAKTLSEWGTSTPWAGVIRAMDGNDQGRIALLRPALAGQHSPAVIAACDHLAAYPLTGDDKTVAEFSDELRRLSRSADEKVAARSLRALAATGDVQQTDWVAKYLSAGDRKIRTAAAIGLVQLDDPRGLPALESLVSEPNLQVRRSLLEQLSESRDPRLAHLVVRLLNDRPDVGRLALRTLNDWAARDVVPDVAQPGTSFLDQRLAWQSFADRGIGRSEIAPIGGVMSAGFSAPIQR